MRKIRYCLVFLFFLSVITDTIQAQNENVTETGKDSKRKRKEQEKPERPLKVTRKTNSVAPNKNKKIAGNWIHYAEEFDESNDKGASESNPIRIEKAEHLAYLAKQVNSGNNYANKHLQLTTNLDLEVHEWTPIGAFGNDDPEKRFCGFLHGNGHTVKNMYINKLNDYQGLFGVCGSKAHVENLGIEACYIRGKALVGGLAGEINEGSVSGCYVTGDIIGTSSNIGGLIGVNNGSVNNSYATAIVISNSNDVGGLVGANETGIISNSYASGGINGYCNVGGLVGRNNGNINNCNASGDVNGEEWIGGLVGWADAGVITNCHATGNVMGYFDVGGLIGFNGYQKSIALITNCYAEGKVFGYGLGNYCIGGLAGFSGGTISNCHAIGDVQGEESVGGLVGEHGGNITNCNASGNVKGNFDVGGLVGFNGYQGTMTMVANSFATGAVTGYEVMNYSIGGLVGYSGGTITNCYATGAITGEEAVGGLVGEHNGNLVNSYASNMVNGKLQAGGLVGWNRSKIKSCYASGEVKAPASAYAGGLIGENYETDAIITSCYFDLQGTKQEKGIGHDTNKQTNNVIPKNTEEITGSNLPDGFEANVWQAVEGSYPQLKVFSKNKDLNTKHGLFGI